MHFIAPRWQISTAGATSAATASLSRPLFTRPSCRRQCWVWLLRARILALVACGFGMGLVQAADWRPPSNRVIEYDIEVSSKGFEVRGNGELTWRQEAGRYEAKLMVSALVFFQRTQISQGALSKDGLVPRSFEDQRKRVEAIRFSPELGLVTYDDGTQKAWPVDGQDRVSMLLELGRRAHLAQESGDHQIRLAVNDGKKWGTWQFTIRGSEMVSTGKGLLKAWRLERTDPERGSQQATLWLAPELSWMPAKFSIKESNGDTAVQTLRSHKPIP